MKNLPQISDAEFEVMDIIWKYAPISTNEITDRLANEGLESENNLHNAIPPGKEGRDRTRKGKPCFCLYALREERRLSGGGESHTGRPFL